MLVAIVEAIMGECWHCWHEKDWNQRYTGRFRAKLPTRCKVPWPTITRSNLHLEYCCQCAKERLIDSWSEDRRVFYEFINYQPDSVNSPKAPRPVNRPPREVGSCRICYEERGLNVDLESRGISFNNRSVEAIPKWECPACGHTVEIGL